MTSGDDGGLDGVDFLSSPGGTGSLFEGLGSPLSDTVAGAEMTLGGALPLLVLVLVVCCC